MGTWLRRGMEIFPIVAVFCFHFSLAQTAVSTGTISSKYPGKDENTASLSLLGNNISTTTTTKPVRPSITKVEPPYGPVSGGTEVSISGQDLDCPLDRIRVHLILDARHLNAYNCSKNNDVITCLTPPSSNEETGEFQLQVSCSATNSTTLWTTEDEVMFTYKPNPVIISVFPMESILAGGITQTVTGTNLDSVVHPLMWTGFALPSPGQGQRCIVHNSTLLKCRTQPIGSSPSNDSAQSRPEEINPDGKKVWIGFFLDGVTRFQNFTALRMFHDPEIDQFKPDPKVFLVNENKALSIRVIWPYIDVAADDVIVQVGIGTCTGVQISEHSITCYPPPLSKSVIRYGPSELNTLKVTVSIGQLKRDVGLLHYMSTESFHVIMIVMIAILAFIFIVSFVFGCCTFFGLQLGGCRGRDKKPPFRPMSEANEPGVGASSSEGSNIKDIGKRRGKRSGADATERDKSIECVVMQYRGEGRDPV